MRAAPPRAPSAARGSHPRLARAGAGRATRAPAGARARAPHRDRVTRFGGGGGVRPRGWRARAGAIAMCVWCVRLCTCVRVSLVGLVPCVLAFRTPMGCPTENISGSCTHHDHRDPPRRPTGTTPHRRTHHCVQNSGPVHIQANQRLESSRSIMDVPHHPMEQALLEGDQHDRQQQGAPVTGDRTTAGPTTSRPELLSLSLSGQRSPREL